jgi:hypothetical protein
VSGSRWLAVVAMLALAGLVGLAGSGQADHPAEQVTLVVIDGPRHDLAFDREGPLAPLYEADNVTVGDETWTAGSAKTVPGHAALLSGRAQPIANDGSQPPEGPLVWDRLAEQRGWDGDEMRWLYAKDKLAVLDGPNVGGGPVDGGPRDEAMLDALAANRSDSRSRLVVATFAWPDDTGHEGDWPAHRDSLSTIAAGVAPVLAQAGEDELVLVTADHARYCEEPEDHGRLGPFGAVDDCDAHVPLFAAGWHLKPGRGVGACLTQADLGVMVAEALGTRLPGATGRFPTPLVNASAAWDPAGCPTQRGGLPLAVPGPGPLAALAVGIAAGVAGSRLRRAA